MNSTLASLLRAYRNRENDLPYVVIELSSGAEIAAHFLRTSGMDSLQVHTWPTCTGPWIPGYSTFKANWLSALSKSSHSLLKLQLRQDATRDLQGLLQLDDNVPCGCGNRLLETAPHNQTGQPTRTYGRVGVSLIVRMALDCFVRGQSTFWIQTHPRNISFYVKLHFHLSPFSGRLYLSRADAERLFIEYFFG